MVLTYSYTKINHEDGTVSFVPVVPLTLVGSADTILAEGILDSGSDTIALPQHMAEILGLPLLGKEPAAGIGGMVWSATSTMKLRFGREAEHYEFLVPCKVMLTGQDFPVLLGQEGFFDKFKILFNFPQKKFSLERVEEP